eukprot:11903058-Karenia_brevis.AAC.1
MPPYIHPFAHPDDDADESVTTMIMTSNVKKQSPRGSHICSPHQRCQTPNRIGFSFFLWQCFGDSWCSSPPTSRRSA